MRSVHRYERSVQRTEHIYPRDQDEIDTHPHVVWGASISSPAGPIWGKPFLNASRLRQRPPCHRYRVQAGTKRLCCARSPPPRWHHIFLPGIQPAHAQRRPTRRCRGLNNTKKRVAKIHI